MAAPEAADVVCSGDGAGCRLAAPSCCCHRLSAAAADRLTTGSGHGPPGRPGDAGDAESSAETAGRAPPLRPPPTMWLVTCGLLLLICTSASGAARIGVELEPDDFGSDRYQDGVVRHRRGVDNITVCQSVDIRNYINATHELTKCDIIEGHLKMVLIGNKVDYEEVRFPRLKQVTHFIILYRVQNLPSYDKMFPNLAVIRGHKLFKDYALVLYENQQLRNIGLISLTRIMRGKVRIEKNPYLCYLDTIDWGKLTGGTESMVIQDNGDGCVSSQHCMDSCPNSTAVGRTCWNNHHCQTPQSKHCHRFCEGGCAASGLMQPPPPDPRHCVACKHVMLKGECMENCPEGTFLYEGWRCISEVECIKLTDGPKRLKAHEGMCEPDCPVNFTSTLDKDQRETGFCEKCKGMCPKLCQGDKMVRSVWDLQKMNGCTTINGSLRIQVSGENIVHDLEENLKDITEITGYLRISYSEPIVSLSFLRNLKVIGGKFLESKYYSLYLLQNVNLKSLWPNTTHFKVLKGRAFFHFNHRLCLDKIHNLLTRLNMETDKDGIDVGDMTNGDKVACRRHVMNASVNPASIGTNHVTLSWNSFGKHVTDFRMLLGYIVYYRVAPHRNLSIFNDRNACGTDAWSVVDFPNDSESPKVGKNATLPEKDVVVMEMLPGLMPYTLYAFYVEAMTSLTRPNSTTGRSEIVYFTTKESTPSKPQNLVVELADPVAGKPGLRHESLKVSWDPPLLPNGIITEYVVTAEHNPDQAQLNDNSNNCDRRPGTIAPRKPVTTTTPKPRCCECPAGGGPRTSNIDHEKIDDQTDFENDLQNAIFLKNVGQPKITTVIVQGRRRRSIDGAALANNITNSNGSSDVVALANAANSDPCVERHVSSHGDWCKKYEVRLPASNTKNSTVLHELRHFAEYTIQVSACQAPYLVNSSREQLCSQVAIASKKTRRSATADALQQRPSISNNTVSGHVTLNWVDPPDPNGGRVLSYEIEIHRIDDERAADPTTVRKCKLEACKQPPCERKHELQLTPGNNSLRVRAVTPSEGWENGLGPFSQPVFFVVEAPDGSLSSQAIVGIVLGLLAVLLICSVCVIFFYKRITKQPIDNIYTSWNPYYGGQISYQPDNWEVDIEKVYFEHVIGKGSFGSVYEGTALLRAARAAEDAPEQLCRVAIKTLLEDASMYDRQAFLSEASLMKEFNCYHVVRLMGIVSNMATKSSDDLPRPPFVIMELMAKGDLKSYLRGMRPEDDGVSVPEHCPVLPHIYQMAIQIADGMAYLTQMNSVHRDLAARNCMVAEDMTIKIGDFGMTRHLYEKNYYKKGGKGLLPVRWMGPESLRDGRFTSQSDVWSFGVVLWEMSTYAAQPYQGLSNEEVIHHVLSRNRMARPENCPERLYDLMYRCWEYRPDDRPTFIKLVEELLGYDIGDEFDQHSFYHTQWPHMVAEAAAHDELEPTVLTPLTASEPPSALQGPLGPRRPRIAESEDLSDEECEMELRQTRASADPESNYAEFHAMKQERPLEGRNGGHDSLSSADNSKAHSLQFSSSDGSKGSKASNGSARNGYIAAGGLGHVRTAEC